MTKIVKTYTATLDLDGTPVEVEQLLVVEDYDFFTEHMCGRETYEEKRAQVETGAIKVVRVHVASFVVDKGLDSNHPILSCSGDGFVFNHRRNVFFVREHHDMLDILTPDEIESLRLLSIQSLREEVFTALSRRNYIVITFKLHKDV